MDQVRKGNSADRQGRAAPDLFFKRCIRRRKDFSHIQLSLTQQFPHYATVPCQRSSPKTLCAFAKTDCCGSGSISDVRRFELLNPAAEDPPGLEEVKNSFGPFRPNLAVYSVYFEIIKALQLHAFELISDTTGSVGAHKRYFCQAHCVLVSLYRRRRRVSSMGRRSGENQQCQVGSRLSNDDLQKPPKKKKGQKSQLRAKPERFPIPTCDKANCTRLAFSGQFTVSRWGLG